MLRQNGLRWQAALAALIGALLPRPSPADISDPASLLLLDTVRREADANLDRIRTWSGTILITAESRDAQNEVRGAEARAVISEHSVDFVCDRVKSSFRSNCVCRLRRATPGVVQGGNAARANPAKPSCNIMVAKDAYFRYKYDAANDFAIASDGRPVPIGRTVLIQTSAERRAPQTLGIEVDPLYWFTWRGIDIREVLHGYVRAAESKQDLSHVSVEEEGSRVTLTVRGGDARNEYVIDRSMGACLAAVRATEGADGAKEEWNYQYEFVGDCWIPAVVSVTNDQANRRHFERRLEWSRNTVNQPVAEAEFSLVKLGLRRGDNVNDRRTGERYRIEGMEYPAGPWEKGPVAPAPERRRLVPLVLLANIAIVLLMVIYLAAQKRRKGHA